MHDILCTNACDFYYYVASTRSQPAVLVVYSASWRNGLWHHSLSANAMATLQIRKWECVHTKWTYIMYTSWCLPHILPWVAWLLGWIQDPASPELPLCDAQFDHHTHTHTDTKEPCFTNVLSHGEPKANGNGCISSNPPLRGPLDDLNSSTTGR